MEDTNLSSDERQFLMPWQRTASIRTLFPFPCCTATPAISMPRCVSLWRIIRSAVESNHPRRACLALSRSALAASLNSKLPIPCGSVSLIICAVIDNASDRHTSCFVRSCCTNSSLGFSSLLFFCLWRTASFSPSSLGMLQANTVPAKSSKQTMPS